MGELLQKKSFTQRKLMFANETASPVMNQLMMSIESLRLEYQHLAESAGGSPIDEDFFQKSHVDRQTTIPWLAEAGILARKAVFKAVMAVSRAFIDCAATPIRHNLNIFFSSFGARSLGAPDRDQMIPDLWSTFFLTVPVVSTTFASVGNMLRHIPPDTLGWLLVDEAGQATPQSAVGALMRCRRAVVVGDPLQVPPVTVLPETMTASICDHFAVEAGKFSPPGASVQSLADQASAYFSNVETIHGVREVGLPLLVHRRCSEPMFSISNSVAYENLMVQAKEDQPSAIRDVLGPSAWISVEGWGQDKWCEEEGQIALSLLSALKKARCAPDFYIVTPFVVVQNNMRSILLGSGLLKGWTPDPRRWAFEHVGTIHTVQGRERESNALTTSIAVDDQWNKARLLKIESDLLYATERILPLVVNQAMSGDAKAQKLILDRTVPPVKAVTPNLPQGLPSDDMVTMLHALVEAIGRGEVSPTVGLDVLNMVKQAAELKDGITPKVRAERAELVRTKAQIARLETDVAEATSLHVKAVLGKELARQRKLLEKMYDALE